MFKTKFTSIFKKSLLILALLLFVAGQGVSLAHSFSHNDSFITQSGKEKHDDSNCSLCSFTNFQNQIFASSSVIFAAAVFYLSFSSRVFDSVKASYFRTSNSSRAPPANS